ncbi:zinc-binding dehydrogenase, partial [Candidatus Sumerlaeota bacterium]|nr:zinc-binding dehydrogenase [Candidatus Sumerlaeota bacterium]
MNANQINRILRAGPGHREARLFEEARPAAPSAARQALIRNHRTLIYPAIDLALLNQAASGNGWLDLGCLALGEVEAAGSECELKRGELIFWNGPHADYGVLDEMRHAFARVGDLNPHALLAGIMAEAEEGLSAALGGPDARPASAIVIGQGMLGHLAGQWLRWRGASVVVVENSPKRLEFSKYLGLTQRIDTHNADWRDRIRRWLPAEGAEILVDACGYARPFLETLPFVREGGKALFLGEWRPELNPVQLPT